MNNKSKTSIKLNSEETNALMEYKSAGDGSNDKSPCFALNRKLNNGLTIEDLPDPLKCAALHLESAFKKYPKLSTPQTVYRGIGYSLNFPFFDNNGSGEQFRNLSYWSTTTDKSVALKFIKKEPSKPALGALLKLNLPIGLGVIDMQEINNSDDYEKEILLPRNILWKVVKTKQLTCIGDLQETNIFVKNGGKIAFVELEADNSSASPIS